GQFWVNQFMIMSRVVARLIKNYLSSMNFFNLKRLVCKIGANKLLDKIRSRIGHDVFRLSLLHNFSRSFQQDNFVSDSKSFLNIVRDKDDSLSKNSLKLQ